MKNRLILVVAIIALFGIGAASWAAETGPGSASDPVVSKSYVDSKTSFSPLQLFEGQKLIGGEGAEIIMRSGEAEAIDNNGENGVSDLTAGKDLMTGDPVGLNHLLVVPRDDGRGITALTEVWVMIRGDYTVR